MLNPKKFCVYTCLFGKYEQLNEQPVSSASNISFICFTDDPSLKSNSWEIVVVEPLFNADSIRSQRHIKILAHKRLEKYDYSLYIDNSVLLKKTPEEFLEKIYDDHDIAIMDHSGHPKIIDEFLAVAYAGYDDQSRIFEQLNHYATYSPKTLEERPYWSAIIIRKLHKPIVKETMQLWWSHILRYSRRDQLSANLAFLSTGIKVKRIKYDNESSWFHSWPHTPNRDRNKGFRNPISSLALPIARVRELEYEKAKNVMQLDQLQLQIAEQKLAFERLQSQINALGENNKSCRENEELNSEEVLITCKNGKIIFARQDDERAKHLLNSNGNFNPTTLSMWQHIVQKSNWTHIIDIGANYGEMLINTDFDPSSKLIAIEPNPYINNYLSKTIKKSGLNATIIKKAISDRTGHTTLQIDHTWSGMTGLKGVSRPDSASHNIEEIEVESTTIASIITNDSLPPNTRLLIKIDIEGSEISALMGLLEILEELEDFAAIIECLHLNDKDIDWLSSNFAISLYNPKSNTFTKFEEDKVKEALKSSVFYIQDLLLERKEEVRESSYQSWLEKRDSLYEKTENIRKTVESWSGIPDIKIVLIDESEDQEKVDKTLESIESQIIPPSEIILFSSKTIKSSINTVDFKTSKNWEALLYDWCTGGTGGTEEWLYFIKSGDTLSPQAIFIFAQKIIAESTMLICYSDQDHISGRGYEEPVFKPDFNLDLLRSYPYIGQGIACHKMVIQKLGPIDQKQGDLGLLDIILKTAEKAGLDTIKHIAEPLHHTDQKYSDWLISSGVSNYSAPLISAHLNRINIDHKIESSLPSCVNNITYLSDTYPSISIILVVETKLSQLSHCVENLLENTKYNNFNIIITCKKDTTEDISLWLSELNAMGLDNIFAIQTDKIHKYEVLHEAAQHTQSEYLLFLNSDTLFPQSEWLKELLNQARRSEVGIVAPKMQYTDRRLYRTGYILGLNEIADTPFIGQKGNSYMHRMNTCQNYSALSSECMLIRKEIYDDVGGFNTSDFRNYYSDIDICLKAAVKGYLSVWTPYAVIDHIPNNVVNGKNSNTDKDKKAAGNAIVKKWKEYFSADPAYNHNLSLMGKGFELEKDPTLNWKNIAPENTPTIQIMPADHWGCGNYRVIQPFLALQKSAEVDGFELGSYLNPTTQARITPDTIVLQRQFLLEQIESIKNIKELSDAFIVYDIDDYLPNLPLKSIHRKNMPKDILKSLRHVFTYIDRLVVSTKPLAEAFKGMHPDIKVVENKLPLSWWKDIKGNRRHGEKPRIGWAGGSSHTGDLEIIKNVVIELANEVEWVFMGMKPEGIEVDEFYEGVLIEDYPAKLASLDLDIALAPLEQNKFNECKSNLKLLEFGACGFPVICTDILPFQGELPVTRVKNRHRDWMAAIRSHMDDLNAAAIKGDILRTEVHKNWMLEGRNLELWKEAWLK